MSKRRMRGASPRWLRAVALLLLLGAATGAHAAPKVKITSALTSDASDLDDELRELNEDVARDADDWVAWRDLGVVRLRTGHPEDALRALERAEEGGLDDPYLAAFHALALESVARFEDAAHRFERAAEGFPEQAQALRARARLLRARAALHTEPTGPRLALLPPVDLGGTGAEMELDLAFALREGLETAGSFTVLGPQETERALESEGRVMTDLDDPDRRRLAGRALSARGVEGLVSSSFLRADTGELHLRLALLPVSNEGLGEALSVATQPGAKGAEFATLPEGIAGLAEHGGVELKPETVSPRLPAPVAAMHAYRVGRDALQAGRAAEAVRALGEAAALAPAATALVRLSDELRAVEPWLDDPLVISLGRTDRWSEELREVAKRTQRRKRRFDDH